MKRFLLILISAIASLSAYAASSSVGVTWTPDPSPHFSCALYDENDQEIKAGSDIELVVDSNALKASAKVTVKWAIVSDTNVTVYVTPLEAFAGTSGSLDWYVYEDGNLDGKKGIYESLPVYNHIAASGMISDAMGDGEGRDIVIEADLAGFASSIKDSALLEVGIRSV